MNAPDRLPMLRDGAADGRRRRRRLRLLLMLGGPLLLLLVGGYVYVTGGRYVSTDDAYIEAARVSVSAQVSGQVTEVAVHDNQPVKKGEVLFRLDERPYRIAVEEAEARLATARLEIEALKASYRQQLAEQQAAQDTLAYEQREFERQKRLISTGATSQAQYDQALHARDAARQKAAAAEQQIASVLARLGGDPQIPAERHPTVKAAQAQLDHAALDLAYTVIRAPDDGTVTKVEQLQPGDYVKAGTPVFSLVSSRDVWVEANFKETALTYMRPGQSATVEIDTYPDKTFDARVESLTPGTGSTFSLLPPENATGNWVKVVQRLAVRLAIENPDPARPLAAGLSAVVEVDTKHTRPLLAFIESAFAAPRTAR
jgi:membrane fusion protein (multidrug efflux system)